MTSEDHRPTVLDLATPTLDPCTVRHAGWLSVGLVGYDDGVGMLLVGPSRHELEAWGNLSQPLLAGPTTHDGQRASVEKPCECRMDSRKGAHYSHTPSGAAGLSIQTP
jgi:hypothetical protein